jgi:hypothetical protein
MSAPRAHFRHVSWGAVFAGMVSAVVVPLVLSLLGAGIGLSTVDPLRYNAPDASTIGLGAGVWWVVSSLIALFAGGWVAGHLSGSPEPTDSVLHGLLTWGVATIVTMYLLASLVGTVARSGAGVVSKTAGLAASSVSAVGGPAADLAKSQLAANGVSFDNMKDRCRS